MTDLTKASQLCPAPHLEAADLDGADRAVTIKRWEIHPVGEEKTNKGVLFFEEYDRGLVLNRTNTKRLQALYGNELANWVGKRITLYPSETDYGGRTVDCIRVREKAPE